MVFLKSANRYQLIGTSSACRQFFRIHVMVWPCISIRNTTSPVASILRNPQLAVLTGTAPAVSYVWKNSRLRMMWLVQAELRAELYSQDIELKAIGPTSKAVAVGDNEQEEKLISLERCSDIAANSSLSKSSSTGFITVSVSGVSSTSARCATGLRGLLARYSSHRPSIPPPGWKQVPSVCPLWPQFEHMSTARVPRLGRTDRAGGVVTQQL